MTSFYAPVNPPSPLTEATANLTSTASTPEATGSPTAAPSAIKPSSSLSSDPQSARLLLLANAALGLPASPPRSWSTPSAIAGPSALPPQHVFGPPQPPPSRPSTAQAPLNAFTAPPSDQQIVLAPYVPSKNPQHNWSEPELNILCCLRIHTTLSYNEISSLIQRLVGGPRLGFEVLRYKCSVLEADLPPSERARRTKPLEKDARWAAFEALTQRALPVQSVLRACGHERLWVGQAEEDALAVLVLHSDLDDAEIARRLNEKFEGECSEKLVRWWYTENVGSEEGSWAWFEGKEKEDAEVKRVLGEFGL